MKKSKILVVSVLLCMVLFLITACGGGQNSGGSGSAPQGSGTATGGGDYDYSIGLCLKFDSNASGLRIIDAAQTTCDALNCKLTVKAGTTADQSLQNVEELLAAGVDGIVMNASAGITNRLLQLCEEAGVFLVICYTDVTMDEAYPDYKDNPFFVGQFSNDYYQTAYDVTQEMIDAGAEKLAVFCMPPGIAQAFDLRAEAAIQCIKDNGKTLAGEARGNNLAESAESVLTQWPDVDAIFSGVQADLYLMTPIANAGRSGQVLVNTYDAVADNMAELFDNGEIFSAIEGESAATQMATIMLYNAMKGNMFVEADGSRPEIFYDAFIIKTGEEWTAFQDYAYKYSEAATQEMVNACTDLETFKTYAADFSLQNLINAK